MAGDAGIDNGHHEAGPGRDVPGLERLYAVIIRRQRIAEIPLIFVDEVRVVVREVRAYRVVRRGKANSGMRLEPSGNPAGVLRWNCQEYLDKQATVDGRTQHAQWRTRDAGKQRLVRRIDSPASRGGFARGLVGEGDDEAPDGGGFGN